MGRCQSRIKFINSPKNLNEVDLKWTLCKITKSYEKSVKQLVYEFVSRERIVEINSAHLNHRYETDVITFDYCDQSKISGEIYLCLDVIIGNAIVLKVEEEEEINRVIFHGFLHLLGYRDKTQDEIGTMRQKEELCLKLMAEINE